VDGLAKVLAQGLRLTRRLWPVGNTAVMSDARRDEFLSLARDLERRDRDVAGRIDAVLVLLEGADSVRARAQGVASRLDAIPAEIDRSDAAVRDAEALAARAQAELAEAESRAADVERSRRAGAEARAEAERALRRATVASADATATLQRLREHRDELRHDAVALAAEGEGLAVEARELGRAVREVPRLSAAGRVEPGASLAEIDDWAARVHSALFVVRGSLESERERLVHEANALAAAVLGEQVGGTSVALVRQRLEAVYTRE
jgi:chromosome segregation ATPase